jgi:hypothetical protein
MKTQTLLYRVYCVFLLFTFQKTKRPNAIDMSMLRVWEFVSCLNFNF